MLSILQLVGRETHAKRLWVPCWHLQKCRVIQTPGDQMGPQKGKKVGPWMTQKLRHTHKYTEVDQGPTETQEPRKILGTSEGNPQSDTQSQMAL